MEYPGNCKNKVYINPNFNKNQVNNLPNNSIMHINPKFSHFVSNVQSNIHMQSKNKIFINPTFLNTKTVCDSNQSFSTTINNVVNKKAIDPPDPMVTYQQQSMVKEKPVLQVPIANSRYCLVRQKNEIKVPVPEKPKNTFKINKYKSVPWNDVKKNLNVTNNNLSVSSNIEPNSNAAINTKYRYSLVPNKSKNEFKLINHKNVSLVKCDRIKTKICLEANKKVYKSNHANQIKLKKIRGNLKKNNIPCPLFRKFGKCLRNTRDKCEFLHDKKHVSICRKFIKGLCHDKNCLLSHDLTTEKMPTCYFYLQGTCTKTDCPYLHVKLNEKAKVCLDFLKGYCEKGSKCLQRHINVPPEKKNKRTSLIIKSSFKNKHNVLKTSNDNNFDRQDKEITQNIEINCNISKEIVIKGESSSEYRYYQDQRDDSNANETCEVIKPMRCKLGTLPSFIQL